MLTAVRNNPAAQLVLLDHGLYREVEPEVRLGYARLWKSIVLADPGTGWKGLQFIELRNRTIFGQLTVDLLVFSAGVKVGGSLCASPLCLMRWGTPPLAAQQ